MPSSSTIVLNFLMKFASDQTDVYRSFLVMHSVICTKFHGYIYNPNFEAEKHIIKFGYRTKETTKLHVHAQMLCNNINSQL